MRVRWWLLCTAGALALGLIGLLGLGGLTASEARTTPAVPDDRPEYLPASPAPTPASPSPSAPPSAGPSAEPPAPQQSRAADGSGAGEREASGRVLYLGDSLGTETQRELGDRLTERGHAYRGAPYSGTTLCDYLAGRQDDSLVPPEDKAAELVRAFRPTTVVLQFWGNSWGYTPCMRQTESDTAAYYARYADDARALTREIHDAARDAGLARPTLVWVLQGPDAMRPDRVRRVNDLYTAHARATGGVLADAGARVAPAADRYAYAERLPCTAAERARAGFCENGTARMHRSDDLLHFCLAPTTSTPRPCPVPSPGIVRYTQAIADTVHAHLRR
ncbi:SGNH/GDSL hydrolase family protein [Streptomyces sp. 549]|uniref:SGNH/GDSL hydrolase family protein n=1 Tax=Streptomyces sp. 549 TaxID=3049076 RepID=UPI0024C3E5A6|nr:SGNH/GDSL hydrolase family protein [Streptomyces sp. 549]MDK1472665.1 SGNH/GDSL hydrolase family protein [Streptomyces sp. 549]